MALTAKPVVLCILDGWGLNPEHKHNAVALAKTPTFDHLWHSGAFPTTKLHASGEHVGLPIGQIGNSEVGHLNLGAGRVVCQTLPRMSKAFAEHSVSDMPAFMDFVEQAKTGSGRVHLMGLASKGGVHAHSEHIVALDALLSNAGLEVVLHLWSDGRDVPPHSAQDQWPSLFEHLDASKVASISGRYFALDRDHRWERVEKAFRAMVEGHAAKHFDDPLAVVQAAAAQGTGDEFIEPQVKQGYDGFRSGDSIVCANFRSDRVREILNAMLDTAFDGFVRQAAPALSGALAMTPYSESLADQMNVLFMPETLNMGLGECVSAAGKTQFRLAETEKYPHVTFFFSGGREAPYDGEMRHMAPSPKVATYDLAPAMSSQEVGEKLVDVIQGGKHDVVICNFANPDMVGHTGDLDAAIAACESVDNQLSDILSAALESGARLLVTADHGNCEQMWDPETNGPHTAHTTNLVPLILAGAAPGTHLSQQPAALCDIAPTILALAGIEQPVEMTGRSLLVD